MKQEDKELILNDLSARLSYNVKVSIPELQQGQIFTLIGVTQSYIIVEKDNGARFNVSLNIDFMPYLRPMSSMTEEEREEFRKVGGVMSYNSQKDIWAISAFAPEAYNWLHAHYFDYRSLIPKGLAIEVTNEDNSYKEKLTAPDKIYLKPLLTEEGDSVVRRCTFEKLSDSQIEYTRTDAFIEKACKWLNENITNSPNGNSVLVRNGCVTLGMLVDDFKKYMEE